MTQKSALRAIEILITISESTDFKELAMLDLTDKEITYIHESSRHLLGVKLERSRVFGGG